jgi:hypothetical protein
MRKKRDAAVMDALQRLADANGATAEITATYKDGTKKTWRAKAKLTKHALENELSALGGQNVTIGFAPGDYPKDETY